MIKFIQSLLYNNSEAGILWERSQGKDMGKAEMGTVCETPD